MTEKTTAIVLLGIGWILVFLTRKKRKKNWYLKFQNEIKSTCGNEISKEEALELLSPSESSSNIREILHACEVVRNEKKEYLIESKYTVGENSGKLAVIVIKTRANFPFFYIYSTVSDYDTYDSSKYMQFKVRLRDSEVRVTAHKGANIEVYQMIEDRIEMEQLLKILDGTGIDIEFSNGNIYVWSYFNEEYNVDQHLLKRVLEASDTVQEYIAPKLEYLSRDFKNIADAYTK